MQWLASIIGNSILNSIFSFKQVSDTLSKITGKNIVVEAKPSKQYFIMSILPSKTTVDKITDSVLKGDKSLRTVMSLWNDSPYWTITIDETFFRDHGKDFTAEEVSALLLHECGHAVNNESVMQKVINMTALSGGMISGSKMPSIISSPLRGLFMTIAYAGNALYNNEGINKEIKADKYTSKYGLDKHLLSGLSKVKNIIKSTPSRKFISDTKLATNAVNTVLNNIETRSYALGMKALKECVNAFIEEFPYGKHHLEQILSVSKDDMDELRYEHYKETPNSIGMFIDPIWIGRTLASGYRLDDTTHERYKRILMANRDSIAKGIVLQMITEKEDHLRAVKLLQHDPKYRSSFIHQVNVFSELSKLERLKCNAIRDIESNALLM